MEFAKNLVYYHAFNEYTIFLAPPLNYPLLRATHLAETFIARTFKINIDLSIPRSRMSHRHRQIRRNESVIVTVKSRHATFFDGGRALVASLPKI